MRRFHFLVIAVTCTILICMAASCPTPTPQELCQLECFLDCSVNSCQPTCDSERSTCYSACETGNAGNPEAINTCKNNCASIRNTCVDTCEDTCTDQCGQGDAVEACRDGVWDAWWGGISSGE
jgi:hypothetical protein